MKKINIRHIKNKDISSVYDIEIEAFKGEGYPQFFIRQAFDVCENLFLVAENKKEITGYVLGAVKNNSNIAWILSLAVKPIYFSNGIGQFLMEEILKILENMDIETVLLSIEPNNKYALNLYLKLGFIKSDFIKDYFGKGESRIIMKLRFTSLKEYPKD